MGRFLQKIRNFRDVRYLRLDAKIVLKRTDGIRSSFTTENVVKIAQGA